MQNLKISHKLGFFVNLAKAQAKLSRRFDRGLNECWFRRHHDVPERRGHKLVLAVRGRKAQFFLVEKSGDGTDLT